ncbi:MAG: hypothetical protein KY396_04430 [Actinobacteria bacterium]|nr:hypothetical protein [Actinomycetota bacterium]
MFEREQRRETDEEIEFDFFDDTPSGETSERTAPPRRRPRLPTRPPAGGGSALIARRAGLIIGAIVLAVVLVMVVNSCREDQRTAEYEDYLESVATVGGQSADVGQRLNQLIFSSGIKLDDLTAELEGLRREQSQAVANAERLKPPGPLRDQQESLVQAMLLRVEGLNGLSRAFDSIATTADGNPGVLLAQQSDRLVASDVIYEDLFAEGTKSVLDSQGITGIAVPESDFVRNRELASPTSWKLIVDRLTQPQEGGGGLHGNQIAGVRVLPGGKPLSPTDENTVQVSTGLAFEVLVKNSGDNQETQVRVDLTIQQSPESIRREQTIDIINPGDTKSVTFRDLSGLAFGPRTILKVTVEPVPGEENTNNNTAEYVVIFTLG